MKKIIIVIFIILILIISYKLYVFGVILFKILIGLGILIIFALGVLSGWYLRNIKK